MNWAILKALPVDIAFTQPSMAPSGTLKSSFAGVAVVTCLEAAGSRSSMVIGLTERAVRPAG